MQILRKMQQTYQYDIINAVSMHLRDTIQDIESPFIKEYEELRLKKQDAAKRYEKYGA